MSLTPYSREVMRSFKAEKDWEIKNMKIDCFVKQVYEGAVRFAETNSSTTYKHVLGDQNNNHHGYISVNSRVSNQQLPAQKLSITKGDIVENMEGILTSLRSLFPDCSVEYKKVSMATGRDGKEYDISVLDDKLRPFIDVNRARITENIVIDWS
jgi:hypothetical protein